MKPTPEQIKQMAIELADISWDDGVEISYEQLQSFFTRAYELGWNNRGESDAGLVKNRFADSDSIVRAIRNNTGE